MCADPTEKVGGGILGTPRTTSEGIELIGPDTTFLDLHLKGIGSEDTIVFRWNEEHLP